MSLTFGYLPELPEAACAEHPNPDIFFPANAREWNAVEAQVTQLCGTCPVSIECLQFAIDNDEQDGIWGGFTPREREAIAPQAEQRIERARQLQAVREHRSDGHSIAVACDFVGIDVDTYKLFEIRYGDRVQFLPNPTQPTEQD